MLGLIHRKAMQINALNAQMAAMLLISTQRPAKTAARCVLQGRMCKDAVEQRLANASCAVLGPT